MIFSGGVSNYVVKIFNDFPNFNGRNTNRSFA